MKSKILIFVPLLFTVLLTSTSMKETSNDLLCRGLLDFSVKLNTPGYQTTYNIYENGIRFDTNPVCGATAYQWTIGDFSVNTSTPYIIVDANDFLLPPAGGCKDFNKKLTNLIGPVKTAKGTYNSSMSVKANAGSMNKLTLPIQITNVPKCIESSSKDSGYEGSEGDYKWTVGGLSKFGN